MAEASSTIVTDAPMIARDGRKISSGLWMQSPMWAVCRRHVRGRVGFWVVSCPAFETFSDEPACLAVVDDFGNLVRVS